jgi:hypothetical protein
MKGKYKEEEGTQEVPEQPKEEVKEEPKKGETSKVSKTSKPSNQSNEVKSSSTPTYYNISIETKLKEVIDLDAEGYVLSFESEPDKFKKLPDEVVNELSRMNRDRYRTSYELYKGEVDQKDHPENYKTPGVDITSRYASATARLEIEGQRPGMRYCWATESDVKKRNRMGYQICHDPDVKTFHKDPDGLHRVADERGTELILMEAPESAWTEHRKKVREKTDRRTGAVSNTAENEIRSSGYKTFDPKRGPGGNFSAPVDEKGQPLGGPSGDR